MSRAPGRSGAALAAFALSGAAGLIHEVVWARYLALLLGSGAYGQAAVLGTYLGGLALGSLAVARISPSVSSPLRAYAAVEAGVAVVAVAFHPLFLAVSAAVDGGVLPGMGAGPGALAARWLLGAALVLPGAVLLGATFPLMAAALVREAPTRPGGGTAVAYMANTLGGAAGVLLGGFALVPVVGLPGSLAVGAGLNLLAAALVLAPGVARGARAAPSGHPPRGVGPGGAGAGSSGSLARALLVASFATAVASFGYEVAWTRMLSLVLGGATHSFEIMLSAFILGLALGAFLIRPGADPPASPLRLLGAVQVLMGMAAVATLPLYVGSFDAMAFLVSALAREEGGYALFNASRYAMALLVMLPATTLAGMTLPLITGAMMGAGGGEGAIGRVFGWNTLGAVAGVLLAALVVLPGLGVKGLLVSAAALDVALGVWLLGLAGRAGGGGAGASLVGGSLGALACGAAVWAVTLDPVDMSSAVFRYGSLPPEGSREVLYRRDGRTATVAAYRSLAEGRVVITTNGKPDASLDPPMLSGRRDTLAVLPLGEGSDASTQFLAPLLGLAHAPAARRVANVGHGSGMSAAALLTGATVEEVVTLEIEPAMVEGSRVFLPANRAAFQDPRSRMAYGDARVLLAFGPGSFDLVVLEPSNPWVSGNAGLFTREFYGRVRAALTQGGILAQWIQLYELDDALALSVLSALSESFPYYHGYLVGDRDLLLVARADGPLPPASWSALETPGADSLLLGLPRPRRESLEALELLDQDWMAPVVGDVSPNSDFRPVLDYGAEAARFAGREAGGLLSLARARVDVARTLGGRRLGPWSEPGAVLSRGLVPMARLGRASWLQEALRRESGSPPPGFPEWGDDAEAVRRFEGGLTGPAPADWRGWVGDFLAAEELLHGGTALWADTVFYGAVTAALDRWAPPEGPREAVALLRGVATGDFPAAAAAADHLLAAEEEGGGWIPRPLLVDASVVAYLMDGRRDDALALLGGVEAAAWGIPLLRLELLRGAARGGPGPPGP